MIKQVRAQRRVKAASVAEAAPGVATLDGETVILRKASGGYTVEPIHPGRVGTRILGYFVPVSGGGGKGTRRTFDKMIFQARGRGAEAVPPGVAATARSLSARASVPVRAPDPVPGEDPRDGEVRRWREIREGFLLEHRSVTAPELARLTGSRSRNPSSRAHEWLRTGKVFAVHDGGSARYPLFQIDEREGTPRPEIRDAVAHLRERLSDWQIALWFVTANAWTGDWSRPVDLLGREPKRVIDAARHEVAEQVL